MANELTGGLSIVMTATPSEPTSMVTLHAIASENLAKFAPLAVKSDSIEALR